MNLAAIRDLTKQKVEWHPSIQTQDAKIDIEINNALAEIWSAEEWQFAQKTVPLMLPADITPGDSGITVGASPGSRLVQFSSNPSALQDSANYAQWQGQTLVLAGRVYVINRIEKDNGAAEVWLAEPVTASDGQAIDTADWRIAMTQIRMPADCSEVLHLGTPDSGLNGQSPILFPLPGLPQREAESLFASYFTANGGGLPLYWSMLPPMVIPPAGKTVVTPVPTDAVDPSNTYGIPAGKYARFTWAWTFGGRIGPLAIPSEIEQIPLGYVSEVPVTATYGYFGLGAKTLNNQVAGPASGYDPAISPVPAPTEGLNKVWFWDASIDPDTGESQNGGDTPSWRILNRYTATTQGVNSYLPLEQPWSDTGIAVSQENQMQPSAQRASGMLPTPHGAGSNVQLPIRSGVSDSGAGLPDGVTVQIRLYPHCTSSTLVNQTEDGYTTAQTRIGVRYRVRPPILVEDTDSPPLPEHCHSIVAHLAAASILTRFGELDRAAFERKLAADKIKTQMTSRYVVSTGTTVQRKGFRYGGSRGYDNARWGTYTYGSGS